MMKMKFDVETWIAKTIGIVWLENWNFKDQIEVFHAKIQKGYVLLFFVKVGSLSLNFYF